MGFKTAFIAAAAATVAIAAPVNQHVRRGNLPTPVSAATARSYLNSITIEAESNSPAYDRDEFNHWIAIEGNCSYINASADRLC